MYFSLVPTPGYDISYLETCSIGGEWELFHGVWTGSALEWGGFCWMKGKLDLLRGKLYCKILSQDILAEGKLDVLDVFGSIDLTSYNITDAITESQTEEFWLTNMAEMMRDTRPTYPSSKVTFTIANVTKQKSIRFFNIYFNLNGQFDVDMVLEDSQRNFLSSFTILLLLYLFH